VLEDQAPVAHTN
jgi:hypothetical protein